MLLVVFAHPYPDRSRANRVLLDAVSSLEEVRVHSLYDRYPDFGIDEFEERRVLVEAEAVIFQHPIYWYSVPGLLKHWFDKVLVRGFAYGAGGTALRGKRCLWAATTGGEPQAFSPEGMHGFPFESFLPPFEQTARFCGMQWEPPLIVHGAHRISDSELWGIADDYRARVRALAFATEEKA